MQIKEFLSNEKLHPCECINDFLGAVAGVGILEAESFLMPLHCEGSPSFHQDVCVSGQWCQSCEFLSERAALQVRLVAL